MDGKAKAHAVFGGNLFLRIEVIQFAFVKKLLVANQFYC